MHSQHSFGRRCSHLPCRLMRHSLCVQDTQDANHEIKHDQVHFPKKMKTCSRSGGLKHSAQPGGNLEPSTPMTVATKMTCLAIEAFSFEDYEKDTQHLESLSPRFASQVDIMLCCRDGQRKVAYPAHKTILSAHSPVLSKILEQLQPTSDNVKQQSARLFQLPMVDDDCAAIRSALHFVYAWLPSEQATPYTLLEANLKTTSSSPEIMVFAHKYGMSNVLLAQEAALLRGLHKIDFCTQPKSRVPSHQLFQQKHTHILECAAIAETCGCNTLLTFCEAIIAVHFHVYQQKPDVLTSKLSTSRMYMICQGVLEHQQQFLKAIGKLFGKPESSGWSCIRCQGALKVQSCFISHQNDAIDCRWPDTYNTSLCAPTTIWSIAEHLAKLQKLPLAAVWHQTAGKYSTE